MIDCPEYDYNPNNPHTVYLWCLRVIAISSFVVNPVIIYCILYRSPSQMRTYRWFLLLHQLVTWATDIWISSFAQAIILVPFPAGYMLGFVRHYVSSSTAYGIVHSIVVLELMTVLLLFFYRYRTVHQTGNGARAWKCYLLFLAIVLFPNMYFPFTLKATTEETLNKFAQNYSCITPSIFTIDSIVAIEKVEFLSRSLVLELSTSVIIVVIMILLTIGSWRATITQHMSAHLRLLQQRFLFQLCLQAFIPFILVLGPVFALAAVVVFDFFGFLWVSDVVLCTIALFSIISAVTLFVMNPNYHRWVTRHFSINETKLVTVSLVKSNKTH